MAPGDVRRKLGNNQSNDLALTPIPGDIWEGAETLVEGVVKYTITQVYEHHTMDNRIMCAFTFEGEGTEGTGIMELGEFVDEHEAKLIFRSGVNL